VSQLLNSFVYGAAYAALALMRSIMEFALRDHYGAQGADLNECIRNARPRLPRAVSEAALHRLRRRANAILHLEQENDQGLSSMDEVLLEEVVSLLFVPRALIEGIDSGLCAGCIAGTSMDGTAVQARRLPSESVT
jgi:hypothetical protein